jgi:hypothetical protein
MILDQRQMSGASLHGSVQSVKDFWVQHAENMQQRVGFMFDRRRDATGYERSSQPLTPHVSQGRWCADCPRCNGGIALWKENDEACCLDCGTIYNQVAWPSDEDLLTIENAMALIDSPTNRNWRPELETVTRLVERVRFELPPKAEEVIAKDLGLDKATVRKVIEARDRL